MKTGGLLFTALILLSACSKNKSIVNDAYRFQDTICACDSPFSYYMLGNKKVAVKVTSKISKYTGEDVLIIIAEMNKAYYASPSTVTLYLKNYNGPGPYTFEKGHSRGEYGISSGTQGSHYRSSDNVESDPGAVIVDKHENGIIEGRFWFSAKYPNDNELLMYKGGYFKVQEP